MWCALSVCECECVNESMLIHTLFKDVGGTEPLGPYEDATIGKCLKEKGIFPVGNNKTNFFKSILKKSFLRFFIHII